MLNGRPDAASVLSPSQSKFGLLHNTYPLLKNACARGDIHIEMTVVLVGNSRLMGVSEIHFYSLEIPVPKQRHILPYFLAKYPERYRDRSF